MSSSAPTDPDELTQGILLRRTPDWELEEIMTSGPAYYLEIAAGLGLMVLPIVALILLRHRLGVLNAASWLVVYGAVFVGGENAGWTLWYSMTSSPPDAVIWTPHAEGHAFMAAVYAIIGLIVLVVIARTMLPAGSRLAWRLLLFALLAGGSMELVVHGPIGLIWPHTAPPNVVAGANFLFAYVLAWSAALIISSRAVFASEASTPRQ